MASNHTTGQPSDGAMLQLEGVSTFYGPIQALDDVSLVVNRGEIVTLIGSNGAGKTTLLMTVCGNPRAATGHIRFEGQDIARLDTPQIMRNGIAISPEGRRVFADMTVTENLQMGGFFQNSEDIEAGLEHAFNLFPRLRERAHQRPGPLAGGVAWVATIGNHDSASTAERLRTIGWTVTDGTVENVGGLRVLGEVDPERSPAGRTFQRGEENATDLGMRLAGVSCDAARKGNEADVVLIHRPDTFGPLVDDGCAPLLVAGHVHEERGMSTRSPT